MLQSRTVQYIGPSGVEPASGASLAIRRRQLDHRMDAKVGKLVLCQWLSHSEAVTSLASNVQ
jgi:hypothetical protein